MNADNIISAFNSSVESIKVEAIFNALGTYYRPKLPESNQEVFHDWILIRRKGVELGFVDSNYQTAAPRSRWGEGELLLTQAYFYAGFDHVQPFSDVLPKGLCFTDDRGLVRAKLAAFEATRHSYKNDTWDVDGYRLSITYTDQGKGIDRIACRILASPIQTDHDVCWPALAAIMAAFGADIYSEEFLNLWGNLITKEKLQEGVEENEIDLRLDYGVTISLVAAGTAPIFQAITLHRNRDMEGTGWKGDLPFGLQFDDSPAILFEKINQLPEQHSDSPLTGHAVWHFSKGTLHILYSNLDNRLLRIRLIAPGTWKCIDDE